MISQFTIRLVNDTIDSSDVLRLTEWLRGDPRLTKSDQTVLFEQQWSAWQGRKYSVFVNSGSSANLAMLYALMLSGRMQNKKVVVPAISWVTTVSPVIQLGLEPIMCDSDRDTLGIDIDQLRGIFENERPSALIIVHVLGFPNKMEQVIDLCLEYGVILLEDSCESVGSTYEGIKTGSFGLMSSFSTYYGHHFSTIEGGIVNTDDEELYHILLSIRSHGWDRDLPNSKKEELRKSEGVSDFRALYTFYYPGFNLRSTDLQAFIGIGQLQKLDGFVKKRNENFLMYQSLVNNDYWKIKVDDKCFVSNFAYPIILPEDKFAKAVNELQGNGVEIRPLVCGSISQQPFWKKLARPSYTPFADIVHNHGMYLPNNPQMTRENIEFVCSIINSL